MDERTFVNTLRKNGIDLHAGSLEEKALMFSRALKIAIPPKNISDRTAFRNLTGWLRDGCHDGSLDENTIFRRVLDFALEASGPGCRRPAAVFMSICRKELGYGPKNGEAK